jgi:hypothetical protein
MAPQNATGKSTGVVQQQCHARLARNAVGVEQIGHAVAAGLQLAVGQRLVGIDEGRFRRRPCATLRSTMSTAAL